MTEVDFKIARRVRYSVEVDAPFYLDANYVFGALVDHPATFDLADPQRRINVKKIPLTIRVSEGKTHFDITTNADPALKKQYENGEEVTTRTSLPVFEKFDAGEIGIVHLSRAAFAFFHELYSTGPIAVGDRQQLARLLKPLAKSAVIEGFAL